MNYYLGYWKYKDWQKNCLTNKNHPVFYSNADILEKMLMGSELWLFTRKRGRQTVHIVQRIKVNSHPLPPTGEKDYMVEGQGLARSDTIEATKSAIDNEADSWLDVLNGIITFRGKSLKSKTAGKYAQRVQKPLQITKDSADILKKEWENRFG